MAHPVPPLLWTPQPPTGPPPGTAGTGAMTRAAALIADQAAVDHVIDVLTSTLRSASVKDNPYHLARDHITIDKTSRWMKRCCPDVSRCLMMWTKAFAKLIRLGPNCFLF
jgi:hypothetical protein